MKIGLIASWPSFIKDLVKHWQIDGHEVKVTEDAAKCDWKEDPDLLFLEWANENAVAVTNFLTGKDRPPTIVRLHRYELFSDFPRQINWQNVDGLVVVAEWVREQFPKLHPDVKFPPVHVIPNGLDVEKWTFRSRFKVKNPKIAFVGDFSHKKNIPLLLQAACVLPQATFHIAGPVYDLAYWTHYKNFCDKAGIARRVLYEGKVEMNDWLEDKDFIICTSAMPESQGMALMEAMAKGIKPLVFNFMGAETLYPETCIWTTLRDLHDTVAGHYNSYEYREWVKKYCDMGTMHGKWDILINNVMAAKKVFETVSME